MPEHERLLFISYARRDKDRVREIVDLVREGLRTRNLPVSVWMDFESLVPGENWASTIEDALARSVGLLSFQSHASLNSEWSNRELFAALSQPHRFIVPIFLDDVAGQVPDQLARYQGLHLTEDVPHGEQIKLIAGMLDALESNLKDRELQAPLPRADLRDFARETAQELRNAFQGQDPASERASVFLVHGHDTDALELLTEFLEGEGVEPVLLARQDHSNHNLLSHFMAVAGEAQFAVALLSADDLGASVQQYDAEIRGRPVAERALQFRARQNVLLELGFFYGKLGFERVFVVFRKPAAPFPNFEWPSDLAGIIWDDMGDAHWKANLRKKLGQAGLIS